MISAGQASWAPSQPSRPRTITIQPADVLKARREAPVVVSYAQNAEDVRLWRVFSDSEPGVYVDVGAGDPIIDSVTKLFYDAGWSGLNIEPGPASKSLLEARPRDVTLDVAVRTEEGEATLWVSSPDPALSSFEPPAGELVPEGFSFSPEQVRCARLDTLIEQHLRGQTIDFLKIDVEGAEHEVLSSFDPRALHPTVILVEAISPLDNQPTYADWEPLLTERDYVFAAFDGINRFYVPVDRTNLVELLAYPVSALDRYEASQTAQLRSANEALERRSADAAKENELLATANRTLRAENASLVERADLHLARARRLESENLALAAHATAAAAHVEEMRATVSWRVTSPLRAVRRLSRGYVTPSAPAVQPGTPREVELGFARRVSQVAAALRPDAPSPTGLGESLAALESALQTAEVPDRAKAWVALVTIDGSYPDERSVDHVARLLRMAGPRAVRSDLVTRFADAIDRGPVTTRPLDVCRDRVVVDVTHTVSNDLHTGIQRVVRETVSRWIAGGRPVDLVSFDFSAGSLRRLAEPEHERLTRWREHLGGSGTQTTTRTPEARTGDTLVPWRCRLVLPELSAEPARCSAYRVLASSSVLRSLGLVAYDLIPMVAADTVTEGMASNFAQYLSLVKHADRMSAISRTSADGFEAFSEMVASEGLKGPSVAAHPLPTEAPQLTSETIRHARDALGITDDPLVLMVGSHEPRKNHLAVLEAAERLWRAGATFQLVFVGGSGWKSEAFDELVGALVSAGRPIRVRKRCTENELWAAYSLARFTVFPSLLEGFGLPVAESLAAGTPVIASSYGSMAEIAEGGGCLVVDPRDVDSLLDAMARLLEEDELLERLRAEAAARRRWTWDEYATELWAFLVESGGA